MNFWMSSPYCRELEESELARPGDVIAMRSMNSAPEELHGMIYVSPLLVFSKDTSASYVPFELKERGDVYHLFRFDYPSCHRIRGLRPPECNRWANFYRCRSPRDDRAKEYEKNQALKNAHTRLEKIEAAISRIALTGEGQSTTQVLTLRSELDSLLDELQKTKSNEHLFFKQAMIHAIRSMRTQADILLRPK